MKLTQKDLIRAACRAIYLWEFGDDEVGKADRVSDAKLMNRVVTAPLDFEPIANADLKLVLDGDRKRCDQWPRYQS